METTPNKRGRPSTFTQETADEICLRIGEGETLRSICRDDHMPSWHTVYAWLRQDPHFSSRFARARELGFDAIAEETVEIVDAPPERFATLTGDRIDPGHVQWQKNRVEQRLKLLAKWSPKKYGERQAVELSGSLNLNEMSDDDIRAELALLATVHAATPQPATTDDDDCSDLF